MGDDDTEIIGGLDMSSPSGSSIQAPPSQHDSSISKSISHSSPSSNANSLPLFPPPKSDKPRPHVCATCLRSFARLEHLKRHERSHTKEKPFECPECTRCFARRDLLLRHQQKLHSTTTPSSRPRSGRRESAAGVANGRVRKNSVANASAGMRPRANTLSHIDSATLGMLANVNNNFGRGSHFGHGHHSSLSSLPSTAGFQYRGMSSAHHSSMLGLPKLETAGLATDMSGGLRTAPPFGGFGAEFGMNAFAFPQGHATTINPHALHFHGLHGLGIDGSPSPFQQMFGGMSAQQALNDEDTNFEWIAHGFENQMSFFHANENAIDDSSPSAMSINSPTNVSELILDGNTTALHHISANMAPMWSNSMANQTQMVGSPISMDFPSSSFTEILPAPAGTISPKSLLAQSGPGFEMNFPTPPDLSVMEAIPMAPGFSGPSFSLPFNRNGGASTASTSSMDSSIRRSSVTTMSSDLVNDHIRNVLIAGLSQNAGFGQQKYSQPSISSPLSPGSRTPGFNINTFPSTQDLQRYVSAYIRYFHPHLPFLHICSLNFDSPEYTTPLRTISNHLQFGPSYIAGGGSCLILSIAAIGALYEYDMTNSTELFECAKRLINCYLEERRKNNLNRLPFGPGSNTETEDTPLWLVQAMLLNVIYGHNCGDKMAADIASNHCAALVSLARGAELTRPYPGYMCMNGLNNGMINGQGLQMGGMVGSGWSSIITEPDDSDWHEWKVMEERKRTLYAVFILSSLLVTAYNHPPALTNSEIRLDLPCDEELWCADNAQTWRAMGGSALADSKAVAFGAALGHLLTAAQRQQRRRSSTSRQLGSESQNSDGVESELKPSTFGCLILVNALHNYTWETRQRHLGRQWTTQETEQMHAHIEPALRAWQAAWASNPTHSLERPNPFGTGPLSADSIPLLDLAYVRLFVNLGRSKEAFWQRDFDAMAQELAKGADVMQNTESNHLSGSKMFTNQMYGESCSRRDSVAEQDFTTGHGDNGTDQAHSGPGSDQEAAQNFTVQSTIRERHLRKAAFYAADSLSMSDKLGLSFSEHTSRELPLQSAMCAFDCAQVLAEWVTTVQERVGRYLGIIDKDEMDLHQVPGIMLLEDEDRKLLDKINEVLVSAERKMSNGTGIPAANECGLGSKILILTAHMLDRAAVWPVTKLMARSLETQARHMKARARNLVIGHL